MSIENAESANPLAQRYIIAWALALVFYFLEYAARSSPAVMIPQLSAAFGTTAVGTAGLNIMPNRWINFRPEIRGDFASGPSFGSVRSANRERSQFTVAFDIILKFH